MQKACDVFSPAHDGFAVDNYQIENSGCFIIGGKLKVQKDIVAFFNFRLPDSLGFIFILRFLPIANTWHLKITVLWNQYFLNQTGYC